MHIQRQRTFLVRYWPIVLVLVFSANVVISDNMEILNPKQQVLTNYEVLMALREIKDQKLSHGARNLATITYETIQYLENTPCKDQTLENITKFIEEVKQFSKLTKSEVLTMVNEPPSLPLHIQLIVEESEERLTDSQVDELIQLSKKYLIPIPPS